MELTSCHVELHVSDLNAARRFYVDQLGLEILQETPAINLLAVRAGTLRLSIFGMEAAPSGPGPVHVVLTSLDLDRTVKQMQERGVIFAGAVIEAPGFCRYVQTRDPAGNLVGIAQYLRDPLMSI
jgi:predicted enzyme related to lactoylglutathione lyase